MRSRMSTARPRLRASIRAPQCGFLRLSEGRGTHSVPAMTTLHVEPRANRWIVRPDGASHPLSVHAEADEACRVARERARAGAAARVLLHDRYHRVRQLVGASPG